ncbi:CDGSH iron-sulfur domain-containing protein 2-like protein [Armadillidium vulgare]|nr:CDGSH iron-sulfur domain-containing protein 2-like protein [Armadillidium vulgare]
MVYAIRDLTKEQLAALVPFGVACALVGYGIRSYVESKKGGHCNLSVRKNESKVVDSIDMEDLGDKASLCRCWRSAKFSVL